MAETPTPTTTTVAPTKGAASSKYDVVKSDGTVETSTIDTGLPPGVKGGIYDLDTAPRYLLNKMTPSKRYDILKILFDRNQYSGAKMGNGIEGVDVAAFTEFLSYANSLNMTYDRALAVYKSQFPPKTSTIAGSGTRAPKQVSSPDDLKAVFKKASMDLLGRTVDDNVANQFVQSFQNQQIATQTKMATQSGGVVTQTPDAGVSAEKMIGSQFGEEVRVQNAANFGNIMDEMIKGLAR